MFNPLDSKGNNSATSNNTMDVNGRDVTFGTARRGLAGRAAAPPSPLTVLLYDGPLLRGFNVAFKGLNFGHLNNTTNIR